MIFSWTYSNYDLMLFKHNASGVFYCLLSAREHFTIVTDNMSIFCIMLLFKPNIKMCVLKVMEQDGRERNPYVLNFTHIQAVILNVLHKQ